MSETGTPPPEPRTTRTPRGVKIALAISLSLNLLVVGLIGGAALGRDGGPREGPAIRTLGLGPFAFALPRDRRDDVRRRIEADAPELRRERSRIGHSFRALQQALETDPFDRDAAARALTGSREAATALQARGHTALLDTLEEMSAAERAVVAQNMARAMRRIPGRDH